MMAKAWYNTDMAKEKLAEKPIPKTTSKQKRLARKLVEAINSDEPYTKGGLILQAGYSFDKSRSPRDVIDTPGVKYELEQLGFSEEKAKEVVGGILGDIDEKAGDRLKAAEIVFKVHGTYAPERNINVNLNYTPDPKSIALAGEFEAKLKGELK